MTKDETLTDAENKGRRPVVSIEPSIRVEFSTKRRGDKPLTMHRDDGSISAFMKWQMENKVFPFRGGASGGGFYVADFPAEHTEAITAWLAEAKLLPKAKKAAKAKDA